MPGLKLIAVCVVITTAAIITGNPTNSISEECMTCLCEGATGCNMTAGCQSTYPGALFCGPFHISWQYWLDAGSPTLHDAEERRPSREIFQECTLDYDCAATTVENYVHKFVISLERDCDGDGLVNCADYAKVHKRGGYACNQTDDRPTRFYGRFNNCWDQVNDTLVQVGPLTVHGLTRTASTQEPTT